jgi:predicted RNase H-like nuclease (RuvC/YqgF family)
MELDSLMMVIGIVGTILGIGLSINTFIQRVQLKKEKEMQTDNRQDIELVSIKSRVSSIEKDVKSLKEADLNLDEKILKYMDRVEVKLDNLNNKLVELLSKK